MKHSEINKLINNSVIYNNGRIMLMTDVNRVQSNNVILTSLFSILYCKAGSATFQINGKSWSVNTGDMLVVYPNSVLHSSTYSDDFDCICICLSIKHVETLIPLSHRWHFRNTFENSPVVNLNDEQRRVFIEYFDMLCWRAVRQPAYRKSEVIDALILAFIYEIDGFKNRIEGTTKTRLNSAEEIYAKFGSLLYSTFPKKRTVAYYADLLFITPKYLSSVCKEIKGCPATEIIEDAVFGDIKQLLSYNNKSIKEIAYDLGFPDASSFGKYVKRVLGVSPKQFRNKALSLQRHHNSK